MRNDFESGYLAHHGILGQKWGIRRFQNPDGSLTAEGKLRYNPDGTKKTRAERKEATKKYNQKKAALNKARKAKADSEKQKKLEKEYQEKKTQVLKSGKASEVAKYKGQMTNQELSDALNRIRWERELDNMTASETESNFEKIDKIMEKVGKVTNWANKSMDAYDAMATIYNFRHPDNKVRYMRKGDGDKKKK